MVITFCGNKNIFSSVPRIEERILSMIKIFTMVKQPVEFYIGGDGDFDEAALRAAIVYKASTRGSLIYYVCPHNGDELLRKYKPLKHGYDRIIINEPKDPNDSDIVARNKYLVDACDLVIAYVDRNSGEEFEMLEYAKKQGKSMINIALLA